MNALKSPPGKNPEISPETHRGFIMNKQVRNRPILHAMALGGQVHAFIPTGREGLATKVDKLLEELDEVYAADDLPHLLEELGDLLDVVDLTSAQTGKWRNGYCHPYLLELSELKERLRYTHHWLAMPSLDDDLIKHWLCVLLCDLMNHIDMNVMTDEANIEKVTEARRIKLDRSGPFEGWFAEAVFLPISSDASGNKWMKYFADKFDEIDVRDFNKYQARNAITPDDVYRNSYHLRYPQG